MKKLERLAISCGGTGGHFFPGLSIAREFNRNGGKSLLLIGGKHADAHAEHAAKYGIDFLKIPALPLPNHPLKLLPFCLTTWKSALLCRKHFLEFHPQALLAMGSFASLPPAAARFLPGVHVPLFLHEGNALIGKSNRVLSRCAEKMALSFPAENLEKAHCQTVVTGLPLRREIVENPPSKTEAVAEINRKYGSAFLPDLPVALVFGGSLGAASINGNFIPDENIPGIERLQIIHLSGPGKLEEVRKNYHHSPCREVLTLESSPDMQILYAAADLVVSRAGGSTVSELACFGKYAILIPFPFAAEHHQNNNARYLADAGGAEIIDDSEFSPQCFTEILTRFLAHPDEFAEKGRNARKAAFSDAAMNVLRMIDDSL